MEFENFAHKGLSSLYHDDNPRGISSALVGKLRRLLTAMDAARTLDELKMYPGWRLHRLQGDLLGYWSLTVSGNWRIVFKYDRHTRSVDKIDLLDYHGG